MADGSGPTVLLEAKMPAPATQAEIQRFSEWFGALGRMDYRRLKTVGCKLEVVSHTDVVPFKPSVCQLRVVNNTQGSISWRIMQKCRLSNECFVSVSPWKGVVDRFGTSATINVNIVLFYSLVLKHMIYIECTWGSQGSVFYLPVGLNVKPGLGDPSLTYWRIRIPKEDQLEVIKTQPTGAVVLCRLCGVEVVMRSWGLQPREPPPPSFDAEIAHYLSLSHPNLVRFVGAYCEPGEANIFLEHVLNRSLTDFFTNASSNQKCMKIRCVIALDIARALAYLHSKGKVHTEVTGKSVLVDEDLHAKLSRFGALKDAVEPKSATDEQESPSFLTRQHNCYQFGLFMWELLREDTPDGANKAPDTPSNNAAFNDDDISDIMKQTYPDYIDLMRRCVSPEASKRPSILDIVGDLTTICDTPEPRTVKEMNLSTNTSLQDHHMSQLARELEMLDLSCNPNITVACSELLPPTLQQLRLSKPNVLQELSDAYVLRLPNTSTTLELPRWVMETLSLKSLTHLFGFSVTSLSLLHTPHLTDQGVSLLPRSLTYLHLGECHSITDQGIRVLPPALTYFSLSTCLLSSDSIRFLPTTLKELHLPKTTQICSDVPLPPALTVLTVGESSLFMDFVQLPRTLTKLNLGMSPNMTDVDIPKLPPKLTWLNIADNALLTSRSIAFFPQSLNHLRVSGNAKLGDVTRDDWPKDLVSLELPDNLSMTVSAVQLIPRCLTHLDLSSNESLHSDAVTALPPGLTSMALSDEAQINETTFAFLPRGLLTLNTLVSSSYVKDIPRQITSLNLERCHTLVDNCMGSLPPNLTYLKLSCSRITDSGLPFLPRSLVTLHLIDNVYLTDNGIKDVPTNVSKLIIDDGDALTAACLKNLPRSLTYLVLPHSVIFDITDDSVRDIPRNITELNMEKNENLTNAGIVRLPRTLTSLNLSSNENLTDSCVKHLPRGLVYLNVAMSDYLSPACLADMPPCQTIVLPPRLLQSIRDKHIEHMPRLLLSWEFDKNKDVTARSLKNLPRTLTKLSLPPRIVIELNDAKAKYIPPVLTELDLSQNTLLTDMAIRYLPLPLTRLNLYWNSNLTDAAVPLLPRSILYLNLGCSDRLTDACAKHLPRRLLELQLDANSNFTDSAIPGLPRSLTVLNLAHAYKLTHRCLSNMPTQLTSWSMSPKFLNEIPTPAIAQLPRGLRELNLWGNMQIADAAISTLPPQLLYLNLSWASKITNSCIPFLPTTLKTLLLEENPVLEDSCIGYMPRGLTHLNLARARKLTDSSGRYFPPSLLHLDVSMNEQLTDAWIKALPRSLISLNVSSAALTLECIPHLPPDLTSFDMPASLIAAMTTESAALLPRSLISLNLWCNTILTNVSMKSLPKVTSLNLAQNNQLSDPGLTLLPQALTSLILTSNTKLTSSGLRDLPKSLTELNLSSAPITDDGIKALPRSLKKLFIGKARLSDMCITDLPPHLTQLTAVGLNKDLLRKQLPQLKFAD